MVTSSFNPALTQDKVRTEIVSKRYVCPPNGWVQVLHKGIDWVFQAGCCHLQPLCVWHHSVYAAIELGEAIISLSSCGPSIGDKKIGWHYLNWAKRSQDTFALSCACFCLLYFGGGEACWCVTCYRNSGLLPSPIELKCSFLADCHKLHVGILIDLIYCLETFELGILVGMKAAFHQS